MARIVGREKHRTLAEAGSGLFELVLIVVVVCLIAAGSARFMSVSLNARLQDSSVVLNGAASSSSSSTSSNAAGASSGQGSGKGKIDTSGITGAGGFNTYTRIILSSASVKDSSSSTTLSTQTLNSLSGSTINKSSK